MYQYLKNSLMYHKNRPLLVPQDFSQIPVPLIGQRITSYNKAMNPVHPESEALSFYLLNHAFAELCTRYDPQEPMPDNADELANLYITTGNDIALRATYYVLSIITREARHVEDSCGSGIKQLAKDKYGPVFGKFLDLITGVSESKAVLYMLEGKCDMPLGKYCEGMAFIFNEGDWSSAYGGKNWGNVAEQLRKAVCGEVSMEAFTDIVWTLRHNGGPIFNKGMQYHNDNEEVLEQDSGRAALWPDSAVAAGPNAFACNSDTSESIARTGNGRAGRGIRVTRLRRLVQGRSAGRTQRVSV
jgi:hypothetical protein